MAPAHLEGHFSPMQEKGAEPPAGEDSIHLGRPGMETLPTHSLRSAEGKTRGLASEDGLI